MRPLPIANPPNPWASQAVEYLEAAPEVGLHLYDDLSRSVLAHNDSPDLGFSWSLNPYRGCYHGCAYCYARPSHQWLSFGAGTDFERRLLVKRNAPALLAEAFERPSWQGELVLVSGNTDCYQPVEAGFRITRACLEVFARYRNPLHIITKGVLIERDLDVLAELHRVTRVGVSVSVPFWDETVARALEPGVATPRRRMLTVRRLAEAGLDVTVNVAPIVPGLGDRDIPSVLQAAAAAGARRANAIPLRLPGPVAQVFEERLRAAFPLAADRVLARTREIRGGRLNDPRFGVRMRGSGAYADAFHSLFEVTARRLGLQTGHGERVTAPTPFRRPADRGGQLRLFDG